MPRPISPASSLVKPTLTTRFHIDYKWWEQAGRDLHIYMYQHLCDVHRDILTESPKAGQLVEFIHPKTGQIVRIERLTYILLSHCSQQPDYITEHTSLVDAVFRTLLATNNQPMTPKELSERTNRSAETILRTLSGPKIYRGLRPIAAEKGRTAE